MNTCIHVQTCLNIISWNSLLFKLLSCPSLRHWNCLIFLRNPTSLSWSFFFLISFLLHILTEHCCNWLYCLLKCHLAIVTSRKLIFCKLWLSSSSRRLLFCRESSFKLWNIVCEFFWRRMLRKRWLKIRAIHQNISSISRVRSIKMIVLLNWLDLWVRMNRCWSYIVKCFVKGFFHLLDWRLLLIVRVLCSLYSHIWFLIIKSNTMPSSRIILLIVYHFVLLSSLGRALWNPFPSRVVIA